MISAFLRKFEGLGEDAAVEQVGLLGYGTRFKGNIRFKGTLRIDGDVEGDISHNGDENAMLIVHRNATVKGDIVAGSVTVSGTVRGNIQAHGLVEIYAGGDLEGDVVTQDMMIEPGGRFMGKVAMGKKPQAPEGADKNGQKSGRSAG